MLASLPLSTRVPPRHITLHPPRAHPSLLAAYQVNVERTAAMIALTAIHDIMKVEDFQPKVSPAHAPYHGYQADEIIRDHDLALGYVLQYDKTALPCYAALPAELQAPIAFTQQKMCFNHGWLVQAEAPPGGAFAGVCWRLVCCRLISQLRMVAGCSAACLPAMPD